MIEFHPDTHWLFAGRFVVYVLCIVIIWGSLIDWVAYLKGKAPRPVWTYHLTTVAGALSIMLATPAKYEVLRRLFSWRPSETEVDSLLFIGLVMACVFYIFAQITRAYNRGAPKRRIIRGVWFSLLGIAILAIVGTGLDVRLA